MLDSRTRVIGGAFVDWEVEDLGLGDVYGKR